MTDKEQIVALINRYSYTLDHGELESFANLFTKGEWGLEDTIYKGKHEIMDSIMSKVILYKDKTPKTRHISTNIDLTIKNNKAIGKRYGFVIQQASDQPLKVIFSADYHDVFIKENDQWRFSKCHIKRTFPGDTSNLFKEEL